MKGAQVGTDEAVPSKPWWQSKTLIGIAVMLLSQALRHFKVDLIDAELTDMLTLALDTVGAALAIYGRVNARKALKLTTPGGPFNPRAEIRRGRRAGYVRTAMLCSLAFCFLFWWGVTVLLLRWVQ